MQTLGSTRGERLPSSRGTHPAGQGRRQAPTRSSRRRSRTALLRFALDGETSDNVALQAIIAALDRAGIVKPAQLDVAIGTRSFEEVFDSIAGGITETVAESSGLCRRRPDALESSGLEQLSLPLEVIDVEPVEPQSRDFKPEPYPRRQYVTPPITGEDAIAEAARINRKLGVYDRKALPQSGFEKRCGATHFRSQLKRHRHADSTIRVNPHMTCMCRQ